MGGKVTNFLVLFDANNQQSDVYECRVENRRGTVKMISNHNTCYNTATVGTTTAACEHALKHCHYDSILCIQLQVITVSGGNQKKRFSSALWCQLQSDVYECRMENRRGTMIRENGIQP